METLDAVAKRGEAERVAHELVDAGLGIEAILLFGSVARGDAGADSDIDLIAITRAPLRRQQLTPFYGQAPVSLVCHTWESLRRGREDDWSFFVHLREEGEVLYESAPRVRRELEGVRTPPAAELRDSVRAELSCLEEYDDLTRFGAGYLFPFARTYRIARFTCMLDNTAAGYVAFRREDAFELFAKRHADVADDVSAVWKLWPFQARVQGRRLRGCVSSEDPRELAEAVGSAKRVLGATLGGNA